MPFLSFTVPIFTWNIPMVSLIFLKRSPVFPILLFSSISLRCSLRKVFLSLLAILWNSSFDGTIFPFLLCLSLLLFPNIHFAFLRFFFLGMVLNTPPSFNAGATTSNISKGCTEGHPLRNPEQQGHSLLSKPFTKKGRTSFLSISGIVDGLHMPSQMEKKVYYTSIFSLQE